MPQPYPEATRYAIIADNYQQDKEAGIPSHLIEPDPYRRYNIKATLKYKEALVLLEFIKASEVSRLDVDLTNALEKLLDSLRVMGFEWPYDPSMHPNRPD